MAASTKPPDPVTSLPSPPPTSAASPTPISAPPSLSVNTASSVPISLPPSLPPLKTKQTTQISLLPTPIANPEPSSASDLQRINPPSLNPHSLPTETSDSSLIGHKGSTFTAADVNSSLQERLVTVLNESGVEQEEIGEKSKSWVTILKRKDNEEDLCFIAPTNDQGKLIVDFDSSDFRPIIDKLSHLVVGSFVGKRLDYTFVKNFVTKTWNSNDFSMKSQGDHMFTFEFGSEELKEDVLEESSFFIASQLFMIRPWMLFIKQDIKEMRTMPVWVMFRDYPMELWDKQGFSKIASVIRIPLFTDCFTSSRERTSFARVCVEVDTNCLYPEVITARIDKKREILLKPEYAWKPPRCNSCDVFGHTVGNCMKQKSMTAERENLIPKATGYREALLNPLPPNSGVLVRQNGGFVLKPSGYQLNSRAESSFQRRQRIGYKTATSNSGEQRMPEARRQGITGNQSKNKSSAAVWNVKSKTPLTSKSTATQAVVAPPQDALQTQNGFDLFQNEETENSEEPGITFDVEPTRKEPIIGESTSDTIEPAATFLVSSSPKTLSNRENEILGNATALLLSDKDTWKDNCLNLIHASTEETLGNTPLMLENNAHLVAEDTSNSENILNGNPPLFNDNYVYTAVAVDAGNHISISSKTEIWYDSDDEEDDDDSELKSDGEIQMFTDHLPREKSQSLDIRRSARDKKQKDLGDDWITTTNKKKTVKVEGKSFTTNIYGELEPNQARTKKLAAASKKQNYKSKEDLIAKIEDSAMGSTFACKWCRSFYITKEKLKEHFSKDHVNDFKEIFKFNC